MIKNYKSIQFKPLLFKKELGRIWEQYRIYLDFEEEWNNFLDICDNDKVERTFAINNFLITDFLIVYCGLNPKLLKEINCYCNNTRGKMAIPNEIYNTKIILIKNFLSNFH